MKWTRTLSIVVFSILLTACKSSHESQGTLLVKELPAGTEGLELKGNGLAVSEGYQFVKGSEGSFSISRKRDGQSVATGGCGCKGGTCEPKMTPDGIIICSGSSCTDKCGLALTNMGIRTEIATF